MIKNNGGKNTLACKREIYHSIYCVYILSYIYHCTLKYTTIYLLLYCVYIKENILL